MVDRSGEHYYIQKQPYGLVELTESQRVTTDNKLLPMIFRGKLKSLMSDCPSIESEINSTQLDYKSLIKLAKDYQNKVCSSDSCIVFERKQSNIKIKLGVFAGLRTDEHFFGDGIITDRTVSNQIGVTIKFKKIAFFDDNIDIDLCFSIGKDSKHVLSPTKNQSYYIGYEGTEYLLNPLNIVSVPNIYTSVSSLPIDMQVVDFRFPLLVGYNFNFWENIFYPSVGLANKYFINSNNSFQIESFKSQYGRTINPYQMGFIAKLGLYRKILKTQSIGVDVGYEYYFDPSAVNSMLRLNQDSFSFNIAYIF